MYNCKITVIKRSVNKDIVSEYLKEEYQGVEPCGRFKDGQEFIITKENRYRPPEGFCEWAWGDIRNDILTLVYGGTIPHMKNEHANIGGCTDWYRPVYFKIERIE
ncbi:MAG: TIGR04076 family protein [Candidatus Hodarchaeota archaeon]